MSHIQLQTVILAWFFLMLCLIAAFVLIANPWNAEDAPDHVVTLTDRASQVRAPALRVSLREAESPADPKFFVALIANGESPNPL